MKKMLFAMCAAPVAVDAFAVYLFGWDGLFILHALIYLFLLLGMVKELTLASLCALNFYKLVWFFSWFLQLASKNHDYMVSNHMVAVFVFFFGMLESILRFKEE